jgi:GNAT superfamily N-acetyltransferase
VTFTIRDYNPATDRQPVAALITFAQPEKVTADMLEQDERQAPPDEIKLAKVAEDEAGAMVGWATVSHSPGWMPTGKFYAQTITRADWRGRGVGTALYTHVTDHAIEHGANRLYGVVRDDCPAGLRFAERRGFINDRHIFDSTLDLAAFDDSRFAGVIGKVESTGIRFAPIADFNVSEEAQRKLYELERAVNRDIPGSDGFFGPFDEYKRFIFSSSWFRADGQLIAMDGERWVGMCALGYFEDDRGPYLQHNITGVLSEYRGRDIAFALKLLAVRVGRKYRARLLRANNDSKNAPMLAINRKMGYKPEPGKYIVDKRL